MYRSKKIEIILPPIAPAASVDDLRELLRLGSGEYSENALLFRILLVASEWASKYLRKSLISQDIRLSMRADIKDWGLAQEYFQDSGILLPYGPVTQVSRVYSISDDNLETNLDYQEDIFGSPARITLPGSYGRLIIEYSAGYGESNHFIPEGIQQGILQLAGFLYENRTCEIGDAGEKSGAKNILSPFRSELL